MSHHHRYVTATSGWKRAMPKLYLIALSGLISIIMAHLPLARAGALDGQKEIADGSRIVMQERGFSLVPPKGWEVFRDHPNTTLLMQTPYRNNGGYQRTLQLMAFHGPLYIDEITAKEFRDVIENKFAGTSASIQNYRIRSELNVKTEDGRPGILYYAEFTIQGVALMQAHLVLSSDTFHYLLTFTDEAATFEEETRSHILKEAWQSMISIKLSGPTPTRFQTPFTITLILSLLGAGFLVVWLLRRQREHHRVKTIVGQIDTALHDDEDDEDHEDLEWRTNPPEESSEDAHDALDEDAPLDKTKLDGAG